MVRLLLRLRGLEKAAALPLRAAKTAEASAGRTGCAIAPWSQSFACARFV